MAYPNGEELNSTSLLSDGNLRGYWRLESDGTDSGPNGYTLTTTAGPSYVAGNFSDNCADFEADSSQYLTIADASCALLEISGAQSWAFWMNTESFSGTWYPLGKAQVSTVGWIGFRCTSTYIDFYAAGLTTNDYVRYTISMDTGTWYHIAGVFAPASTKLRIYVNGDKVEATASGSHSDSNGAFSLGRLGAWTGSKYDGKINDVAIFNRVLTDEEITTLAVGTAPSTAIRDVIGSGIIPFAR